MVKYEVLIISLGTFIDIHFTISPLVARKTDAAVRVDAVLTGASMETGILVTLIDIVLTVLDSCLLFGNQLCI